MGTPPGGGVREKEQTQSNRSAARFADRSKHLTCLAIILAPWPNRIIKRGGKRRGGGTP